MLQPSEPRRGRLAMCLALGVAVGVVGVAFAPDVPTDPAIVPREDPTAVFIAAANANRKAAGLPLVSSNAVLQALAGPANEARVAALLKRVMSSDKSAKAPPVLDAAAVRSKLPTVGRLAAFSVAGTNLSQALSNAVDKFKASGEKLTHVAVATKMLRSAAKEIHLLLVVGVQLLPMMNEAALNAKTPEFCFECPFCGHVTATGLGAALHARGGGSLTPKCGDCGLIVNVYGIDTKGLYHQAPWFLSDFMPRRLTDPDKIWLAVLQRCRYVEDQKKYGRPEAWQRAKETYDLLQGDCEDSAILLTDWLCAAGHEARVVVGEFRNGREVGGHAWTVWQSQGRCYLLESTGGSGNHRRVPPRADLFTHYHPEAQFSRTNLLVRGKAAGWTGDYFFDSKWQAIPLTPTPKGK